MPVQVVVRVDIDDAVTGEHLTTRYRYHDGHYDGMARQWLGFGDVECDDDATDHEAASRQHQFFHNQVGTATTPAFVAGRGQPYRTDVLDPVTGEVLQASTATWTAIPVDADRPELGAWIAVQSQRRAERADDGTIYSTETVDYEHDAMGNIVREHRRGEWTDRQGVARSTSS